VKHDVRRDQIVQKNGQQRAPVDVAAAAKIAQPAAQVRARPDGKQTGLTRMRHFPAPVQTERRPPPPRPLRQRPRRPYNAGTMAGRVQKSMRRHDRNTGPSVHEVADAGGQDGRQEGVEYETESSTIIRIPWWEGLDPTLSLSRPSAKVTISKRSCAWARRQGALKLKGLPHCEAMRSAAPHGPGRRIFPTERGHAQRAALLYPASQAARACWCGPDVGPLFDFPAGPPGWARAAPRSRPAVRPVEKRGKAASRLTRNLGRQERDAGHIQRQRAMSSMPAGRSLARLGSAAVVRDSSPHPRVQAAPPSGGRCTAPLEG
jgi:hypothetical protein